MKIVCVPVGVGVGVSTGVADDDGVLVGVTVGIGVLDSVNVGVGVTVGLGVGVFPSPFGLTTKILLAPTLDDILLIILYYPNVVNVPKTFQDEPTLRAVNPITSVLFALPVGCSFPAQLTVTVSLFNL